MQIDLNKIPVSEKLDDVVDETMNIIYKSHRKRKIRKTMTGICASAAAFTALFIFLAGNPVLASKLPLIGHIFEQMQDGISYSGDFSEVTTPLEETEASGDTPLYTQTADGITMSLSELYCNGQAVYLSYMLEAEDVFPDTFINMDGNPVLALMTSENISFLPEQISNLHYAEGKFIDDHTYAGILRIDLSEYLTADDEEIPDSFTFDFVVEKIIGDKADPEYFDFDGADPEYLENMSDEEWSEFTRSFDYSDWTYPNAHENYWFEGTWSFALDVTVNKENVIVKQVGTTNEDGIGIESVSKSPFEITVKETYPSDDVSFEHFMVALDADGELFSNSGLTTSLAIQDHDISTIYIYICDYDEYMDELKGYYWSDDYEENKKEKTFQQLLEERSVYRTEISFDAK